MIRGLPAQAEGTCPPANPWHKAQLVTVTRAVLCLLCTAVGRQEETCADKYEAGAVPHRGGWWA